MNGPADPLCDRLRITDQLSRLAAALDTRDWETVRAVFAPSATGYRREGADSIVAVVRDHLGGCGPTQHLLGNHRITVTGDSARSLTSARVHHEGAGPMEGRCFECLGEYDDHWERTPSGWLLTSRTFDMRITHGDFAVLRPG